MTSAWTSRTRTAAAIRFSVSCSSASPCAHDGAFVYVQKHERNVLISPTATTYDEGDGQPRAVRHLPVQQLRQHDGGVQQRGTGAVWAVRIRTKAPESRQPAAFELPPPERVRTGDTTSRNGADQGHVRDDLARGPSTSSRTATSPQTSPAWSARQQSGTDGAVNVENAAGETRGGLDTNALHLTAGKGWSRSGIRRR